MVDLENKSCARVPLVSTGTLPGCNLNQLSQQSKKALQMVCEQFRFTCVHIEMYKLGRDYFHVQMKPRMKEAETKLQAHESTTGLSLTFNRHCSRINITGQRTS